jgi:ATP synthase F1 gamma subunit
MSNIKQLEQTLEDAESLKLITQGYSEISASKLQVIRSSMERNITFARELGDIFHLVKKEVIKRKMPQTPKKPGIVQILLTSNNRFYGNLEKPLTRYFSTATTSMASSQSQIPQPLFVVGKTGPIFLTAQRFPLKFEHVVFKKDLPSADEFRSFIESIRPYQTILVYHSRFKTVMTQIPVVSDITQSLIKPQEIDAPIHYIFEPELTEIQDFFERQILEILFHQTFLESELARTSSRLISMDAAENNANDYLKGIRRNLAQQRRSVASTKALEMVNALVNMQK